MKNLFICFSGIESKEERKRMVKICRYLGGIYSNGLKDVTTHLVTNDVFSQKYYFASQHKMKIMKPEWIQEMWQKSQEGSCNLNPEDPSFDRYKLPIFHKIIASATGLDSNVKKKLMENFEANGGDFSQVFKTATVKIIFLLPKDLDSAKAKAAAKFDIKCVHPSWVDDSIAAGYALPIKDNYIVEKPAFIKASTPTRESAAPEKFHFDNTMLSEITTNSSTAVHMTLEETQRSDRAVQTTISSPRKLHTAPAMQLKTTDKVPKENKNLSTRSLKSLGNVKNDTFKKPGPARSVRESAPPFIQQIEDEKENKTKTDEDTDESFVQFLCGTNVLIYGFTDEESILSLYQDLEKYGANLVDAQFKKLIDYVVTPCEVIELEEPQVN